MATEIIRIVDPDAGSGYHYDSLSDWEADLGDTTTGNLPSDDMIATAKCRCTGGTADSSQVTIDGWTTDSTRYIKVWTDSAESYRHSGKWETGNKYRLAVDAAWNAVLYISELYVRIIGLLVENVASSNDYYGLVYDPGVARTSGLAIFDSVITRNAAVTNPGTGFLQADGKAIYVNCVSYNNNQYGFLSAYASYGPPESHYFNCIAVGNGVGGFWNPWDYGYAKNCYAGGNASGDDYTVTNQTTCASEDSTGTITGVSYSVSAGTYFTNITVGSEDFHLQSSSSLIGAGTNLYNDAVYPFQTDIDGDDRGGSGAEWDIGADEYVVTDIYTGNWFMLSAGAWQEVEYLYMDDVVEWDLTKTVYILSGGQWVS